MSISSVSNSSWLAQLSQTSNSSNKVTTQPPEPPPGGGRGGGQMLSAIQSALSELGVGSDSSSSSDSQISTNNTDSSQALGAFMQQLMQSLRAQNSTASTSDQPSSTGIQGRRGPPPDMASDLQSLISKLGSGSSDGSNTDLQTSFSELVSSLGVIVAK
ncbi:hypothetical protein [Chitinibacter fontanus]|uniref:hypothetical protein n=1 Tax=Chitinibacter fontanus TaxID=1737446 RepID=UPI001D14AA10|nr:hypothetical protein [Chitinibacter fontanus]